MQFCFPLAAALACVLFLAACTEPAPSPGSLPSSSSAAAAAPEATPVPATPAPESSGSRTDNGFVADTVAFLNP